MCEGSVESTIRLCNEVVVVAACVFFMTTKKQDKNKQNKTKRHAGVVIVCRDSDHAAMSVNPALNAIRSTWSLRQHAIITAE